MLVFRMCLSYQFNVFVSSIQFNCPRNHAVLYKHRAGTEPMLGALGQYWPDAGTYCYVYGGIVLWGHYETVKLQIYMCVM